MIHLLPQDLINKIAAGEVVERPASVVKELTENAVDAKATKVEIKIEQGGVTLIQVIDNGIGMSEEDAKLSLVRHATSKISSSDDLFNISSLGFRGEALASIASVSQFDLVTKHQGCDSGFKVQLNGDEIDATPTAANQGTTVTVKNLFYNVPARQKFLKKAQTEYTHILRYLQQFAMVHPDLDLTLTHNGKEIFHHLPSSWEERVANVLGSEFQSRLIPVSGEIPGVQIEGLIAKPELVHATHKNQYLFVNDRPVYDHFVSRSVLEAYDTLVPKGYHPAFVVKVHVDPAQVDVNVHPRKSEVKFMNPFPIINALKNAVRQSLRDHDLTQTPEMSRITSSSNPSSSAPKHYPAYQSGSKTSLMNFSSSRPTPHQVSQAMEFSGQVLGTTRDIKKSPLEEKQWRIVGQIHLSFILVETPDGLQLIDQHAASEIVNYHRIKTAYDSGSVTSQQLLIPESIELNLEEMSLLAEHSNIFDKLGWEIDNLSAQSIQVSALPEILKVENINENIHEMLDELKEQKNLDISKRELELIKYESCRSAIMFGDEMTHEEMNSLLNGWMKTPNNAACEHGRPASAKITVGQMRKFFNR